MEGGRIDRWDGDGTETILNEIPAEHDSRFNDVIADPKGRVYAGTVSTDDHLGSLYRIESDGSYEVVVEGLDLPNGLGFSPDLETMYVTDTGAFRGLHGGRIYEYDYDRATGELSNRRVFADADDEPGLPDGMTVDDGGHVWSAYWDGGTLVRYDPSGNEVERIEFPAKKVSSAAFGGDDCREMYVTTAGGEDRESEGDGAGALFRCKPTQQGREEFRSRIGLRPESI